MLSGPELEKMVYLVIRQKPEMFDVISYRYFHTKLLGTCFKLDKKYYTHYHKIATVDQLRTIAKINKIDELTEDDIIGDIFGVNLEQYDEEWLDRQASAWIKHRTAELVIMDAAMLMKQDVSSDNIDVVVDQIYDIFRERASISYTFEKGLDFFNPIDHYQKPGDYFSTGYPFFDKCTAGGWEIGSLYVIAGAPKAGKSAFASNFAANAVRLGYNTAVISLEMKDTKFMRRIGSNLLNIQMNKYDEVSSNHVLMGEKLNQLKEQNTHLTMPGRLHVKQYPASTASTIDIENYLRRMEETEMIKYKVIIIDYINIMKNWRNPNTENSYSKIKQLSEDLRAMATRNNWAIMTLTQLTRSAYDASDISMSNIAESAGLIHTVDALFGIMRMTSDDDSSKAVYKCKALALRNAGGLNSEQEYVCDFDYMKIIESHEKKEDIFNI